MLVYYVVAAIVVAASIALSRRTRQIKIGALPEPSRGFGKRDEKCTIVFTNGKSIETTFGEIEKKVKEINGEQFWVEKKWDVLIGGVYCVIGLVATAVVYYMEHH